MNGTTAQTLDRERKWLFGVIAFAIILHTLAIATYRFDSDEPQHAHVAWGWAAGELQYRDVFDNHAPLLHITTSPVISVAGETPYIVYWLRLAMVPLYLASLALTFFIASRLYEARVARWSLAILVLFTPFFLKTIEYRNDNPWLLAWLALLALALTRDASAATFAAIGLIFGTAVGFSLKSTIILVAIGIALVFVRTIGGSSDWVREVTRGRRLLVALVAASVVPAAIGFYFRARGAWNEFVYCVFRFNELYPVNPTRRLIGFASSPFLLALTWFLLRLVFRRSEMTSRDPRKLFLVALTFVYPVLVVCFWPIITARDFTPVFPLAAIAISAAMIAQYESRGHVLRLSLPVALTLIVAIELAATAAYGKLWRDNTSDERNLLRQVIRFTHPDDYVFDLKGETVFRRRPFYFILERIGRTSIARGLIADTIARDVVARSCHVIANDGPLVPPAGREFLSKAFVRSGDLLFAGSRFLASPGTAVSFNIGVAGDYVFLTRNGKASGLLDGRPLRDRVSLAAGAHQLAANVASPVEVVAFWAEAADRGASPFATADVSQTGNE